MLFQGYKKRRLVQRFLHLTTQRKKRGKRRQNCKASQDGGLHSSPLLTTEEKMKREKRSRSQEEKLEKEWVAMAMPPAKGEHNTKEVTKNRAEAAAAAAAAILSADWMRDRQTDRHHHVIYVCCK